MLPNLFKRFFRVERSRTDSSEHHGLGLAIVAAIARMHGGQTRATSRSGVTEISFSMAVSESKLIRGRPGRRAEIAHRLQQGPCSIGAIAHCALLLPMTIGLALLVTWRPIR